MRFFIGIPCYRDSPRLRETVDSLQENTATECELQIRICPQSVVKNRNELLQKAKKYDADFVCLTDDDVDFTPEWDAKLLSRMEPGIGQTGPLLLDPQGKVWSAWIDYGEGFSPYQVGMGSDVLPEFQVVATAPGLCGCVTIYSREFLDSVDWAFDDRYDTSQFEDVDQTLTVRERGFHTLYNGEVSVTHCCSGSTPRNNVENFTKLRDKWAEWVKENQWNSTTS